MDKEAYFRYLLDTYERLVYSICFKLSGNQFDAEDLTQETFLSVYKNLATFQKDYEKAWICKIATNKGLDFKKSAARRSEPKEEVYFTELADQKAGPEEAYLQQESKEYVYTICQSLKSPYREVATEHFYREKTAKEISQESGKGIKTIQTQIYRAKAMIQKMMEGRAAI
ncbi:sigma-70 family RNA polymerase sigma factor [Lachnospiraceae bacterium 29-84]